MPETGPGVYVVALTAGSAATVGVSEARPLSVDAAGELLGARTGLTVGEETPDVSVPGDRLKAEGLLASSTPVTPSAPVACATDCPCAKATSAFCSLLMDLLRRVPVSASHRSDRPPYPTCGR